MEMIVTPMNNEVNCRNLNKMSDSLLTTLWLHSLVRLIDEFLFGLFYKVINLNN